MALASKRAAGKVEIHSSLSGVVVVEPRCTIAGTLSTDGAPIQRVGVSRGCEGMGLSTLLGQLVKALHNLIQLRLDTAQPMRS